MKITSVEAAFVKKNYPLKGSVFCAKELNMSLIRISSFVQRNRLSLDPLLKTDILREQIVLKNPQVTHEQFVNVTSPEIAYLLGFIWADGHLSKNKRDVVIGIKKTDGDFLCDLFNRIGPWRKRLHKQVGSNEALFFSTGNHKLWNYLYSLDYRAKSNMSAEKVLQTIPNDLLHYWFRGLVDGDGCFHSRLPKSCYFSITSSIEQDWTYMINFLDRLDVHYKIIKIKQVNKKTKNVCCSSRIVVSYTEGLVKIGKCIYSNIEKDQIGLRRKYEIWKSINQQWLNRKPPTSVYRHICLVQGKYWALRYKRKHLGYYKTEQEAKNARDLYFVAQGLPAISN